MNRLYISIFLLLAVVAGGIASVVYIETADDKIQYLGKQIKEEAAQGEDTTQEVAELCEFWERHRMVMAFIENSGNIASISAEVSRLPALAAESSPDLIQQVDSVCVQCALLSERQFPYIRSML